MAKYMVVLNGIVEADNSDDAVNIFKESAEYGNIECFEYENDKHPWDEPSCQEAVNIGLKA